MEASEEILKGISEAIRGLDPTQVERMLEALLKVRAEGKKTLVVGAGRSGRARACIELFRRHWREREVEESGLEILVCYFIVDVLVFC